MAVASASLHLAPDMPVPYHSSFLQARCPFCRPTNSVKALKVCIHTHTHTHTHTFNGPFFRNYPGEPVPERYTYTHTYPFKGPFSGTTQVSQYQKGKTNLDFAEARDSEWQWHQLGHMQVCTLLQTNNHASTPPLIFYRPDALPATQPTASKHYLTVMQNNTYTKTVTTKLPLQK